MNAMPIGVHTATELHAHYMAVRRRIMRAHIRLLPRGGFGPEHCEPSVSLAIQRPAPELIFRQHYRMSVIVHNRQPAMMTIGLWNRITLRQIIRTVAAHYDASIADLTAQKRLARLIHARQIIYYLGKDVAGKSYAEIGRRLKQYDHTSALYGYRQIVKRLKTDDKLAAEIALIKHKLRATYVIV